MPIVRVADDFLIDENTSVEITREESLAFPMAGFEIHKRANDGRYSKTFARLNQTLGKRAILGIASALNIRVTIHD